MRAASTSHAPEERPESTAVSAMSLCALCGGPSYGADALCTYHLHSGTDDWATGNRIICDFVHRGIVSRRPAELPLSHAD
jgi:hypothetical protein